MGRGITLRWRGILLKYYRGVNVPNIYCNMINVGFKVKRCLKTY